MSDAVPDRLTVTPFPSTVSSARLSQPQYVGPLTNAIDVAKIRKKTEIIKQNSKKRDEILSLDKESQKDVREDITEMEDVEKVKDEVLEYFKKSIAREITGKPKSIGKLTQEGRIYLESISGLSMKEDVDFVLNPSDMTHIFNNHYGENEKDPGNNKPLTDNDIRNMVDVITNPETIIYLGFDLKTGNKTFMFLCKSVDGTYNLAEVYGDRKGNLTAKSFYNTKKDISRRAYELRGASQHSTSETSGVSPLIAKLPKMFELNKFSDENFHYLPEVNIEEDLEDDIDEEEDQTRSRGFHR